MKLELRATKDQERLVQAPKLADDVLQVGMLGIIEEHKELGEGLLIEQQRLIAKYGPESRQAKTAALRLDVHEQMKLGIKVYSERLTMRTPEPSPDGFIVYGRVLNSAGEGIAKVNVAALNPKSQPVDQATTDDEGAFELSLSTADTVGRAPSETIDVRGVRDSLDDKLQLRLEVSDRRKKTLYRDQEPFEITPGFRSYREINLEKEPGSTDKNSKAKS